MDDDSQWCSIYGYGIPSDHTCAVAVCYNPYRDGQELRGTLADRLALAESTVQELRSW